MIYVFGLIQPMSLSSGSETYWVCLLGYSTESIGTGLKHTYKVIFQKFKCKKIIKVESIIC